MCEKMNSGSGQIRKVSPWAWIPTLYFAEGIPYVIVMTTLLSIQVGCICRG